jgi:hypothetical protein
MCDNEILHKLIKYIWSGNCFYEHFILMYRFQKPIAIEHNVKSLRILCTDFACPTRTYKQLPLYIYLINLCNISLSHINESFAKNCKELFFAL